MDNTWEPYALLKEIVEEALWEFYKQYLDKPHPTLIRL